MTFMERRQEIAQALSTVPGVTGYVTPPVVASKGHGFALLDVIKHGPGFAFMATWKVIVILGTDEADAYNQLDTLLPLLVEALQPLVYVEQSSPRTFTVAGNDQFAIELIGWSE